MARVEPGLLDEIGQKTKEIYLRYHGCSWCTLHGLKQYFDFISEDLVTASKVLEGGCGGSMGSCGAYCGGLLAIGAKFNAPIEDLSDEGLARQEICKNKRVAFRDWFLREFGTTTCAGLQERLFGRTFNWMDEKESQEFENSPRHDEYAEKCGSVAGKSARMAAEIILSEE